MFNLSRYKARRKVLSNSSHLMCFEEPDGTSDEPERVILYDTPLTLKTPSNSILDIDDSEYVTYLDLYEKNIYYFV